MAMVFQAPVVKWLAEAPSSCPLGARGRRTREKEYMTVPGVVNVHQPGVIYMLQETKQTEKVIKCINALDFTKDWTTWRETLKDGIATARGLGISDDEIKDMAVRLGDFLAEKVCPATPEEELMKNLWQVASPEERRTLANVVFRMLE